MQITVIYPKNAHSAYAVAASEFARLCKAVTGTDCRLNTDDLPIDADPSVDLVLIGTGDDAFDGNVPFADGNDCLLVRTAEYRGHRALFLLGDRGRSTLYAVYRYFEKVCGCRWFWDGDRIPQSDTLPFEGISFTEASSRVYRGTRYFAHRGLHRFQAEFWNLDDWKREIDWLVKSRLNLLMLRIGQDDLFQKAFPDVVDYPDASAKLPEAGDGFDDRTLFWSLQFRGELRKQVLAYAKERDLLTPEDCGTMTHWYSRTPIQFLERMNPSLLSQPSGTNYAQRTGLAWDIREERNLDLYMHLTETHIREYGQTGLFHTIGLAERAFGADRDENMRLKREFYRLLTARLRRDHPSGKLFVASWDLWMFYHPEEVRDLLTELDPTQAILFDYTSDSARSSNFMTWGVEHSFPWVFGIFHAYQPSNEIRGDYDMLCARLRRIETDEMCKGVVFWPELSHGDPFMPCFFAKNAWQTVHKTPAEQLDAFCADRYPAETRPALREAWKRILPLGKLMSWSKYEAVTPWAETDVFCRAPYVLQFETVNEQYEDYLQPLRDAKEAVCEALRMLAPLTLHPDDMTRRDVYDLARTVLTRYLNAACLLIEMRFVQNKPIEQICVQTLALAECFTAFLETHADYSLDRTMEHLRQTAPVNPIFPETLKKNCDVLYCRSCVSDCARELYLPELAFLFGMLCQNRYDRAELLAFCEQNRLRFERAPIAPFAPKNSPDALLLQASELIEKGLNL
ncbi:MAG: hypothetical protein IJD82_04680 [Clostridia bacterium]|nr:hypothetical protein [Clostridia bacterium]